MPARQAEPISRFVGFDQDVLDDQLFAMDAHASQITRNPHLKTELIEDHARATITPWETMMGAGAPKPSSAELALCAAFHVIDFDANGVSHNAYPTDVNTGSCAKFVPANQPLTEDIFRPFS